MIRALGALVCCLLLLPTPGGATTTNLGTQGSAMALVHGKKPVRHRRETATTNGKILVHRSGRTSAARRSTLAHTAPLAPALVATVPPRPVAAPPPPDPAKGVSSGLPIPRFAALRSDAVSLRVGPGTRYPIDWVYQRRYLPVKIEREFEVWRLVSDADGTRGWVHEAMLTGHRGFLVTGDQPQTVRAGASATAPPVVILKPGVVGQLASCPAGSEWCSVLVAKYRGWLPRSALWGTLQGEVVAP